MMTADFFNLHSVRSLSEATAKFDCVVLVTNHDDFDHELILRSPRRIVEKGYFRYLQVRWSMPEAQGAGSILEEN